MANQTLENPKKQSKYINILFCIYTIVTMAIYILPSAKLTLPYIPVAILMLTSLPLIMFKKNEWSLYGFFLCFVSVVWVLIGYFGLVDGINDFVRNLRLFLPIIWGVFAINYCNKKQRTIILIGFAIVTIIILYNSLKALEEEPWIARLLAQDQSTSSDEINEYRLKNVGGYPFAYMMGAVTICTAWLALRLKQIWQKALCVVAVIFCYSYIIQTMYTTLLILTSVCIFLLLMIYSKNVFTKFILIVVALAIYLGIEPLLQYLSGVFDSSSLLSTKFEQMYLAVSGKGVEALGSRPVLMSQAFNNFLSSPFFGSETKSPSHSLFFELLQGGGIFGTILWIGLYVSTWIIMLKELRKNNISTVLFNACMIYFSALSIFNDTRYTFEITIAVFFIVPVLSSVIGSKKENKEDLKNIYEKD